MRLCRVRFTIKRAMFAVAVLALIMGVARIVWLRDHYRRTAAAYALAERKQREILRTFVAAAEAEENMLLAFGMNVSAEDKEQNAADARAMQQTAEYCAALRRKYEQAAAHPWIPLEPDPPAPGR
jgi:hypothetical protein